MEKQQIFEINPDDGVQTARIRTPAAGGLAKPVHDFENGNQPFPDIFRYFEYMAQPGRMRFDGERHVFIRFGPS